RCSRLSVTASRSTRCILPPLLPRSTNWKSGPSAKSRNAWFPCSSVDSRRLMRGTAVINVVGLTESLRGPACPRIQAFARQGQKAQIQPVIPAVTCTAQSTYLTGSLPCQHGIVANGWYHRDLAEVQFWKQSNHLVHGRKIWE